MTISYFHVQVNHSQWLFNWFTIFFPQNEQGLSEHPDFSFYICPCIYLLPHSLPTNLPHTTEV